MILHYIHYFTVCNLNVIDRHIYIYIHIYIDVSLCVAYGILYDMKLRT